MRHAVTVLQLDTGFPRVPGDVGCVASYRDPVQIIRVPRATVGRIVTDQPASVDITPFEDALTQATGDIVVTSCGFLAPWQAHLQGLVDRPFIASSLTALPGLTAQSVPGAVMVVTFDARSLTPAHLGAACDVVGLTDDMHLTQVIRQDLHDLDTRRAGSELVDLVTARRTQAHQHLLLECTNLPPYKAALAAATGLPITDILTLIEAARPGTIAPEFLTQGSVSAVS